MKFLVLIFLIYLAKIECWLTVGTGVTYEKINPGFKRNNVLITYGGWNVKQFETEAWTKRLLDKSILNQASLGINHVYAVKGPQDSQYLAQEIQNSRLISHLYSLFVNDSVKPKLIIVIAHSSGCFVADEFFGQLFAKINASPSDPVYAAIRRRIVFYNLDGATTPSRKDDYYLKTLFSRIEFVWASKPPLKSMNSGTMMAAPRYYATTVPIISKEIQALESACINSACLHDAVIIQTPWDPARYDTARDYTLYTVNGREVQSAYMNMNDLLAVINS